MLGNPNSQISIQNAILATYFYREMYCDFNNIPKFRKLDREIFIGAFFKKAVDLLNRAVEDNEPFGVVALEIEDSCQGTSFEADYLEVIASNPLPYSAIEFYENILRVKKVEREFQ